MKKLCVALISALVILISLVSCGSSEQLHEHVYGEWRVARESTCLEDGLESRTCECGETENRFIDKSDHSDGPQCIWCGEIRDGQGANYSVNYYKETLEGDEYELSETKTYIGVIGATVNFIPEDIAHFSLNEENSTLSGIVDENGALELAVYYERERYEVKVDVENVDVSGVGIYPYGAEVEITVGESYMDTTYEGIYAGEECLTREKTYKLTIDKDITIKCSLLPGLEDFTYNATESRLEITGIKDKSTKVVVIPNGVTEIGQNAFGGNTSIVSVVIPDSVKEIRHAAFYYCTNLSSVTVGKGVESIIFDAFKGCTRLIEVVNNSSLTFLKDSDSYGGIAYYAKDVHEGESKIVNKDGFLFYSEDSIYYLISYVGADTELTLPASYDGKIYQIYKYAFRENNTITSVTIPGGVTAINESAFYKCESLERINIGNGVATIGASALEGCKSLTSITIGIGVDTIGDYAFSSCTALTSVTVPDNVNVMGLGIFSGCDSLERMTVPFIGGHKDGTGYPHIEYMFGSTVTYGTSCVPESVKSVVITGGTSIGNRAFYKCQSIEKITLPDSVTYIGEEAFHSCIGIKDMIIPGSVKRIGPSAFKGCENLKNLTIENGVESIESYAFAYCTSLAFAIIPDSVSSIGSYAFSYCTALTSLTLGGGVSSIGASAFYECQKLVEVINKSAIEVIAGEREHRYIAYYAKEVHTGETKIKNKDGFLFYTFEGVNYLLGYVGDDAEITLPANYNGETYEIYKYAFKDCRSITSVKISSGVTLIDVYAFSGASLSSVIFENPNGWIYMADRNATSATILKSSDLSDSATATTYLTYLFRNKVWCRI